MVVSSRKVAALGLGLMGVGCLIGPAIAQQNQDGTVRKTATQPAAPAAATKATGPAIVGCVDIEAVLKNYDKVKMQQEEFAGAAKAKHAELMKFQSEAQEEAQKLSKLTPNSVDAKKIEDHLTQLKAQLEAGREQAQRDFALRESEMLATLYKEVQEMVAALAKHKGMTYVVQVSNDPISGSNPQSVMAKMGQPIVYADPTNDITKDVIYQLNYRYKKSGGTVPKASTAAPAAGTPAGN